MEDRTEERAQEIISGIKGPEFRWRVEHGFWREARDALHAADICYLEPLIGQIMSVGRMGSWALEAPRQVGEQDYTADIGRLQRLYDLAQEAIMERIKQCGCQDKSQYVKAGPP